MEKLEAVKDDSSEVDALTARLDQLEQNASDDDRAALAADEERTKKLTRGIAIGVGGAILLAVLLFATHVICFHSWAVATCTEPEHCVICGQTRGEATGHKWVEPNCLTPKRCLNCGLREGEALGHDWQEATCTEPKTCTRCEKTDGKPAGHEVTDWSVSKEATCTEEGVRTGKCTRCGESIEEPIEKVAHTEGEWEVTKEPEVSLPDAVTPGSRVKKCTVCGEVLESSPFTPSAEEALAIYKAGCQSYSYEEIARNPDEYRGKSAVFTGKVIQVIEGSGSEVQLRVNVTRGDYDWDWDDTIYVSYEMPAGSARILEDDVITLYGTLYGTISYESVLGATITLPAVIAEVVEY